MNVIKYKFLDMEVFKEIISYILGNSEEVPGRNFKFNCNYRFYLAILDLAESEDSITVSSGLNKYTNEATFTYNATGIIYTIKFRVGELLEGKHRAFSEVYNEPGEMVTWVTDFYL